MAATRRGLTAVLSAIGPLWLPVVWLARLSKLLGTQQPAPLLALRAHTGGPGAASTLVSG